MQQCQCMHTRSIGRAGRGVAIRQADRPTKLLPCPFWVSSCLQLCSSPPLLVLPRLGLGLSLSLGRGNLICSLLPPVPVAILPSPSEGEFVHCREKKERRSNEIILFADRMSVKISERLCIQSDHSVSLRTVRIQ